MQLKTPQEPVPHQILWRFHRRCLPTLLLVSFSSAGLLEAFSSLSALLFLKPLSNRTKKSTNIWLLYLTVKITIHIASRDKWLLSAPISFDGQRWKHNTCVDALVLATLPVRCEDRVPQNAVCLHPSGTPSGSDLLAMLTLVYNLILMGFPWFKTPAYTR